jgi:hypothetical protein
MDGHKELAARKRPHKRRPNGVELDPFFTIRAPRGLIARIIAKAEADGVSRSDAAREALRLYVGEQDQAA